MRDNDFIFHYVEKLYCGRHKKSYNYHQIASSGKGSYVEFHNWIRKQKGFYQSAMMKNI